jgi:hypothetical protein
MRLFNPDLLAGSADALQISPPTVGRLPPHADVGIRLSGVTESRDRYSLLRASEAGDLTKIKVKIKYELAVDYQTS